MKYNQNKKAGGGQRGSAKGNKFFKRDKKDQKGYSKGRPDNKKKHELQQHFKKNNQRNPLSNNQQRTRSEDKGGYKQYQNPPIKENKPFNDNKVKPSGNNRLYGNKSQQIIKNSFNHGKKVKDDNSSQQNKQGQWTKNFDKKLQNFQGKQNKKPKVDNSDDDSDDETPVINYCLAPNLLEQKLKKKGQFENKDKKVNKREEYLKQKQRRNEILKQKTRRGQPVMNGRMQLLYEKVQKVMTKENEDK